MMRYTLLKEYLKEDFWIMPATPKYLDSGIPYITSKNIRNGSIDYNNVNYISEEDYLSISKNRPINVGDILISMIGTLGETAVVKKNDGNFYGQNMFLIRLDENKIDMNYFLHYFRSEFVKKQLLGKQNKSTQSYLKANHIEELKIPIYSLEDQRKISIKLSNIQQLINIKKNQIESLNKLIKSQFVEMFQNGNFEKEELGKLCDVRDGTHDSPKYLDESEFKFITSKNIINNDIDFSGAKFISKQDYDKFNIRSKVNYGDILMPMVGTIGNPVIVNIPNEEIDFAIKNVALIKFLEDSKVINIYVKNLLNSDYFENAIFQNKRGGTQKFIALSDIRKLEIEVPPIELQNKFARIVKLVDSQKCECRESLKKLEEMQSALMQEYFG